ncbi:hypothetical protein TVAG_369990 [Trichomonas vaginalis G3]|uniref:Uncharacterized protein n=1 Tax=Trichomonas vaginalis (strain ATCC PRA-98 / G3) TaxID=412133 RepID=A2EX51_TRIV3|nr:armadillo (ARM) repeat-containing protein family [Trichomonas vaginalis G3]EAY02771.1 hypothetical protein TVAG_369990 [Trichomonas vaginalis G3]KAI5500605.1 armadillo (ARM) repeat-containing protein family [Trichomonas vaginalis G3]|eukprot:XP_001314994.1 hypothetical protein [Trichomonas vaginalis G3]
MDEIDTKQDFIQGEEITMIHKAISDITAGKLIDSEFSVEFNNLMNKLSSDDLFQYVKVLNGDEISILIGKCSNFDYIPLTAKILSCISSNFNEVSDIILKLDFLQFFNYCASVISQLDAGTLERIMLILGNLYLNSEYFRNILSNSAIMNLFMTFQTDDYVLKETFYWMISVVCGFPNGNAQELISIAWQISQDPIDEFSKIGFESLYSVSKWSSLVRVDYENDPSKREMLLNNLTSDDQEMRNNCAFLLGNVIDSVDQNILNSIIECIKIDQSDAASKCYEILGRNLNQEMLKILKENGVFEVVTESSFSVQRSFVVFLAKASKDLRISFIFDENLLNLLQQFVESTSNYESFCSFIVVGKLIDENYQVDLLQEILNDGSSLQELLNEYDIPPDLVDMNCYIELLRQKIENEE